MRRLASATRIETHRNLLTTTWTSDVEILEKGIQRLVSPQRPLAVDCRVALFELPGDRLLHVNVIHSRATKTIRGWAGPGEVAGGFVHNRTFESNKVGAILRHIGEMVFATAA